MPKKQLKKWKKGDIPLCCVDYVTNFLKYDFIHQNIIVNVIVNVIFVIAQKKSHETNI